MESPKKIIELTYYNLDSKNGKQHSNIDKVVKGELIYNDQDNRHEIISNELIPVQSIHSETGEPIFGYVLKESYNYTITAKEQYKIVTGYYGYYKGCYYWGTLIEGDNGESIFTLSTGINGILNPPICPGGQWA